MTVSLSPLPIQRFYDNSGALAVGGKLYTYVAGTTTPQATYIDSTGGTPNTNPIVLNSRGECSVWMTDGQSYKFVLQDSVGNTLWTVDNIPSSGNAVITALAQLADTSNVNNGDAMIGVKRTVSGAAATTLHTWIEGQVLNLKSDFGAKGDGVTDDTAALNTAFTTTGKAIYIPPGTYYYTSNLSVPTCAAILGDSMFSVTLKPGAAVTKGLRFSNPNYPKVVQDFTMDGSLTTGAVGIIFGETASVAINPQRLYVQNFTGTNAAGYKIMSMLKSTLVQLTAYGCTDGLQIANSLGDGNPTTLLFNSCVMTNSTRYGAKISSSNGVRFINCDFESSTNEGVYVDTALNQDIVDLMFGPLCWFEQNNTAVGATGYHVKVTSNTGSRTVRPAFEKCFFNVGVKVPQGAQRCINFDGQDIRMYRTRDLRPSVDPGTQIIWCTNAPYGTNDEPPLYIDRLNWVNDPSGNDYSTIGPSRDLTPLTSIASESGNAATTFAAGPSLNVARYKADGKWFYANLNISGTLNAVTPRYFTVALPSGYTIAYTGGVACKVVDAGTPVAGWLEFDQASNKIRFWRLDAAAFTSGGAIQLIGSIRGEVT